MDFPYRNRREAGHLLASLLADLGNRDDVVVLGLPRGGVPVAYEVALALDAPLDAYIVRKLGVPGHEELAMGAIASGNVEVFNDDLIHDLRIGQEAIDDVVARERQELARRERIYRGTRLAPDVENRLVVLIDDGLATGTTMLAAIRAVRQLGAREVIVAVPVAPAPVPRTFEHLADRVVCAHTPEPFSAIGQWYEDFSSTTDDEVQTLLADAAARPASPLHRLAPRAQG